ncbi:MAG: ABC transporter ATP-binding protein [Desulfocapsa sp.]|nr:ABC transporter ATP-binding protein [Desulfocapsa sp.]
MISIKNLLKSYDGHIALNHIDLHVDKGVIFGLLGPNGAGKSTLVSILNGLTAFQEGTIEIFGMDLQKNLKAIRRRSTFIPQSLALYENLSVIENLRFFAGLQNINGPALRDSIEYAISVNQLHPFIEQKAATLSGGQKRRLNIAIGLLNKPEILYFDEPTIGIDPESRGEILSTIRSFKEDNKTVIYTSHYMDEIEKICDEAAILDHGNMVDQGRLETMLQGTKNQSAVIELVFSSRLQLAQLVQTVTDVKVIDDNTLLLEQQDSTKMAKLLTALEEEKLPIKQIRYQSVSLESLFISLTNRKELNV